MNKPRNISDFLIETEKKAERKPEKKNPTNREIFGRFLIIPELSNKAKNLKRETETKRQISDFDNYYGIEN